MIRIKDVSFSYNPDSKRVFDQLNLEIKLFSSVVIAGPDGSGKTTLGKLIKGLMRPDSGSITLPGNPMTDVGYIAGDPYDWLIGISVEEDVAFGLENLGLPSEEISARLSEALDWTGLKGMEKRLTHTLSGGEQQRLALAGVLAMGTRIVMLDDAMNMLDARARNSIRSLVASLRRTRALTVIEMTNDPDAALAADRIIFLSQGCISFDGTVGEFFLSPAGKHWLSLCGGLAALKGMLFEREIISGLSCDALDLISLLKDEPVIKTE